MRGVDSSVPIAERQAHLIFPIKIIAIYQETRRRLVIPGAAAGLFTRQAADVAAFWWQATPRSRPARNI